MSGLHDITVLSIASRRYESSRWANDEVRGRPMFSLFTVSDFF